jgi:ADP-heptose:LPS heptosyltransferase
VPLQEIPPARLFAGGNSHNTVVIHPFASAPDKTWPADRFLALAEHTGLEAVFIGAATDDMTPFRAHRCLQGADLEQVKTLLAGAALFIGNDSGPAHMAAAFGVPSLVFFGNSDIDLWRPWKTDAVVLSDRAGIRAISLERALEATAALGVKA